MADEECDAKAFDDLMKLYEIFTNVQLQAETIYHNRTNLVLIAEGLLLVALPAVIERGDMSLVIAFAAIGEWLSVIWFLLEQRNRIHYKSRDEGFLRPLEDRLVLLAQQHGRAFAPFWSAVPAWVERNARWYQKHSAQRIMRTYTPATFIAAWILAFAWAIVHWLG
jgi:hypothetical protein